MVQQLQPLESFKRKMHTYSKYLSMDTWRQLEEFKGRHWYLGPVNVKQYKASFALGPTFYCGQCYKVMVLNTQQSQQFLSYFIGRYQISLLKLSFCQSALSYPLTYFNILIQNPPVGTMYFKSQMKCLRKVLNYHQDEIGNKIKCKTLKVPIEIANKDRQKLCLWSFCGT